MIVEFIHVPHDAVENGVNTDCDLILGVSSLLEVGPFEIPVQDTPPDDVWRRLINLLPHVDKKLIGHYVVTDDCACCS
jgi:hypothetical protein